MMNSFQWVKDPTPLSYITPTFTLPETLRPHLSQVTPQLNSIPLIDMMKPDLSSGPYSPKLVEEISRACEEYGFFQIINHGVPEGMCTEMLEAVKELMELPPEQKSKFFSEDVKKDCRLYSRQLKVPGDGKISMWSEVFYHSWHPDVDFTDPLPKKPVRYRDVVSKYAQQIDSLITHLLSLISLSLGLDKDYLKTLHGNNPRRRAQANYYPPCPNPELTLGLAPHTDLNTLTVLLQTDGVCGLQVMLNNNQWVTVEPVPNSFIINLGDQLQVLSNARYKSVLHRAVTNKDKLRVSFAMFYGPDEEMVIGPVEDLVDENHAPLYREYKYREFVQEFIRQDGMVRRVKEAFEVSGSERKKEG